MKKTSRRKQMNWPPNCRLILSHCSSLIVSPWPVTEPHLTSADSFWHPRLWCISPFQQLATCTGSNMQNVIPAHLNYCSFYGDNKHFVCFKYFIFYLLYHHVMGGLVTNNLCGGLIPPKWRWIQSATCNALMTAS